MLEVSQELIKAIDEADQRIRKKYEEEIVNDKEDIRRMISLRIDKIRQIKQKNIESRERQRGIAAVDGSIYTEGASFPHYISIMQAKGKATLKNQKDIMMADIHSPLLEEDDKMKESTLSSEEKDERIRSKKLAHLELKTALKLIEGISPEVLLIDGPLTRYASASSDDWEMLKMKVKAGEIGILGIIEEVKTAEIAKRCTGLLPESQGNMYDREMLFGILDIGDMFILKDWEIAGIKKCFIRTANDPQVIGIEFLEEQEEMLEEYLSLVLSITPKDSRGIPLWLDIVDSEVRITEKLGKAILENYIDNKIRHKLFAAKRNKRKY